MYSLAVIYGTPSITDQQSHESALLLLTHAAIQVVDINSFCGMFVVYKIFILMVEARR